MHTSNHRRRRCVIISRNVTFYDLSCYSCVIRRTLLLTYYKLWSFFHNNNKAFIGISRLCHAIATPLAPYGPLRPNATSSVKPEVHNVSQRRHRGFEPRPQGICAKQIRDNRSGGSRDMLADRQTHTQTHRQTNWSQYYAPLPGRSKCVWVSRESMSTDPSWINM